MNVSSGSNGVSAIRGKNAGICGEGNDVRGSERRNESVEVQAARQRRGKEIQKETMSERDVR